MDKNFHFDSTMSFLQRKLILTVNDYQVKLNSMTVNYDVSQREMYGDSSASATD